MSLTVDASTNTNLSVQEKKSDTETQSLSESLKPSRDEAKASLKQMEQFLKQAEDAEPGKDKNIQKARDDLKEVGDALNDVWKSTKDLEKAQKGGDPAEIEEKLNAAVDSQEKFVEKYDQLSQSMEKATGAKLPPLNL